MASYKEDYVDDLIESLKSENTVQYNFDDSIVEEYNEKELEYIINIIYVVIIVIILLLILFPILY